MKKRSKIIEYREWTAFRLSVFRSNLAISAALRELRLLAEISATAIAREIGVSQSSICGWEMGRGAMSEERQAAYHRALTKLAKQKTRRAA